MDNFSNRRDYMNDYRNEEKYLRARKKLDKIVGFYWHLAVYLGVNVFLIILIGAKQEEGQFTFNFGTFSTAFFWGIGLFFHWASVFGQNLMLGKNWEKRKIQEILDKENTLWE